MENNNIKKVVLVTGANRGLGFAIVKNLLQNNQNFDVILTSRDEKLGKESIDLILNEMKEHENRLHYHQLDIENDESIKKLVNWIKEKFEKIDILVNNAAVYISQINYDTAKTTFDINVYGTINFTEKILSENLIRPNGKIVILGSVY